MTSRALLTVDLGFGDAGKGSIVDALTRYTNAHTVVRYNGGAQAAHRVFESESGREHVFSQFGSGTLAGAATHLSRFMLIEPLGLLAEEQHLRQLGIANPFEKLTIDRRALVITPFTRAITRLRELARGDKRHGSCGVGIGETMADFQKYGDRVLFAGDLLDPKVLREKLYFIRARALEKLRQLLPELPKSETAEAEQVPVLDVTWVDWLYERYEYLARRVKIVDEGHLTTILQQPGSVIFEGAQGVLLDEWYGFHPYTTWSTTTLANAECLLNESCFQGDLRRIGITRAYMTRHGAGPMPSYDMALSHLLPDARNITNPWQEEFRVGWLDMVLLRYALELVQPLDMLAVTCLDRVTRLPTLQVVSEYISKDGPIHKLEVAPSPSLEYQEVLTQNLFSYRPHLQKIPSSDELLAYLEEELRVPIGIRSYGPSAKDKVFDLDDLMLDSREA